MSEPPTTGEPESEADIHRAAKAAAILGGIFATAALGLYGTRTAASVALGAIIAVANLLTMRAIVRALLQAPVDDPPAAPPPDTDADEDANSAGSVNEKPVSNAVHRGNGRRGGVAWGLFAVFKIILLFGGIWLLLTRKLVDPMPLVVGYGVMPLGITASALWSSLGPRRR